MPALWIVVTLLAGPWISAIRGQYSYDMECETENKKDIVEVSGNNPGGRLLELHIRHNLQVCIVQHVITVCV